MASKPIETKSTQSSLLINEIKDGVVILRDGSLRAVVLASAINFDLMSEQERNGVEFAFQGFLNSLHFPIQILVKSQKIDIDAYIEKLQQLRANQDNELLGLLMDDYILNIQGLVEETNIMRKQFYVVVPFFPSFAKSDNIVSGLAGLFKPSPVVTISSKDYDSYRTELQQRVQLVTNGLNQIGVRAIPLNTQELVELYYASYNPDVAINQKLIKADQFQTAAVTRLPSKVSAKFPKPLEEPQEPTSNIQQPAAPSVRPMPPTVVSIAVEGSSPPSIAPSTTIRSDNTMPSGTYPTPPTLPAMPPLVNPTPPPPTANPVIAQATAPIIPTASPVIPVVAAPNQPATQDPTQPLTPLPASPVAPADPTPPASPLPTNLSDVQIGTDGSVIPGGQQ